MKREISLLQRTATPIPGRRCFAHEPSEPQQQVEQLIGADLFTAGLLGMRRPSVICLDRRDDYIRGSSVVARQRGTSDRLASALTTHRVYDRCRRTHQQRLRTEQSRW